MSPSIDERFARRWSRRALTIPGYVLGFLGLVLLLPALLPLALILDLLRDPRLPATRLLLLAVVFLGCETFGLAASAVLVVAAAGSRARWMRWHYGLQRLWARTLFAATSQIFGVRVDVEGDDAVTTGPLVLLVRHASLADTLLPAVFVSHRHGLRLRYVLKRELLWDPCLDVVGQRLPNVFVQRGAGDSASEIAAVRALAAGLGVGEGVLIYPEGTRFTAAKQARAVLARADPDRAARVAGLRRVLPPRPGGPLALLDALPDADVLFLAHVGLDGAATLGDMWRGALIERPVRLGFWCARGVDVPRTPAERLAWLDAQWLRMDEWIATRAPFPVAGGGPAPVGA